MDTIVLNARYGFKHKLEHIKDNKWKLILDPNSSETYRILGFPMEHEIGEYVSAIDPDGGPFIKVDSKIDEYTVKTITRNGILELVKI